MKRIGGGVRASMAVVAAMVVVAGVVGPVIPGAEAVLVQAPVRDLGRIQRQQDFVQRALKKANEKARGLNFPAITKLVDTGFGGGSGLTGGVFALSGVFGVALGHAGQLFDRRAYLLEGGGLLT